VRIHGKGNAARLFLTLLCVALIAGACGSDDKKQGGEAAQGGDEKTGGTLVFGADQDFPGYNVNTVKDNTLAGGQIMKQVWSGAYRVKPDFSLEPDVLAGEATVTSEDPFTVEWKIKPEASWDDGTPLSSDDFELYWQMCNGKNKEASCASTTGFDLIAKLDKVDAKTVRGEFAQPFSDYKSLFDDIPPSHIIKKLSPDDLVKGWNTALDNEPGASSGPFKVGERVKGASLKLVRNEKYWGTKAKLDEIIFRFLPESTTQPDALRNGEVNMIYPQPQLDQVETVKAFPGVHSEINFGPTFEHLTLNTKNEFLADKAVRQAIAYGVDRAAIVTRLMKPFSDKASQLDNRLLVSTQKGYEAHGQDYAKVDVAKAISLLEGAGFKKGATGIMEKGGKKLSLRLSTTAGNKLREQQGVLIQAQLKDVGIDIRIDNSPAETLFGERLPGGNFDIANFAWVGTPFPAAGGYQIYSAASGSNFGKYNNKQVDEKLLAALAETDEVTRLGLLNEIDKMMWEDVPNIPLYQKPTFLAYNTKYVNISDNTTEESPFWNSETWALKA
jgi:peptide/nickel transport system substrate-binding protein